MSATAATLAERARQREQHASVRSQATGYVYVRPFAQLFLQVAARLFEASSPSPCAACALLNAQCALCRLWCSPHPRRAMRTRRGWGGRDFVPHVLPRSWISSTRTGGAYLRDSTAAQRKSSHKGTAHRHNARPALCRAWWGLPEGSFSFFSSSFLFFVFGVCILKCT